MQILLVEDDASLAQGLQQALRHEGFSVNRVGEGEQALRAIETEAPDIVILDLGLPDMDGLNVLGRLRKIRSELPVLILTARASLEDKVSGLDSGADDYLAKPFDIPELLARLRVLERRLGAAPTSKIENGPLMMDIAAHKVSVEGRALDLSRREYMLLKALLENAGKIQTRNHLETRLYSWGEEIASNAVEVHVHNLRKKLPPGFIKTVRGVGYTIDKS